MALPEMKGLGGGLRPKMAAPAAAAKKAPEPKTEAKEHEGEGMAVHELHDHGDGTAHTVSGGETTEHPDIHHAVAHIAHKAMGGGPHFHAHHDGMSLHSHGISDAGQHTETTEHSSPEEMHSAMDAVMGGGEGGAKPTEEAGGEGESGGMLGGFKG